MDILGDEKVPFLVNSCHIKKNREVNIYMQNAYLPMMGIAECYFMYSMEVTLSEGP